MNCLQGEFSFCHSSESHCQGIKSQHNTLKHFCNDKKIAISSSSSFCRTKIMSKRIFQSISFSLSNQVQSVQTERLIYLCSKDEGVFFCLFFVFTIDKRANIMNVSRFERKSLWRCTQFEWMSLTHSVIL